MNDLIRGAITFQMPEKPDGMSKREFVARYREALLDTQDSMISNGGLGADDFPTEHYFCEGVYIRQLFVPAGVFLIGRTHKTKHLNVVMSGAVNIISDGEVKLVEAYAINESLPHLKRAGYVLRDMLWATVHRTEATTVEEVEKELFYTYDEERQLVDKELKYVSDNLDYEKILLERGIKEEDVQKVVMGTDDRENVLPGCFTIDPSQISGLGIFAKEDIRDKKFTARTETGKRTDIGRYTNHSTTPNAKMVRQGKAIMLSINKVTRGDEITIDYRESLRIADEMR